MANIFEKIINWFSSKEKQKEEKFTSSEFAAKNIDVQVEQIEKSKSPTTPYKRYSSYTKDEPIRRNRDEDIVDDILTAVAGAAIISEIFDNDDSSNCRFGGDDSPSSSSPDYGGGDFGGGGASGEW